MLVFAFEGIATVILGIVYNHRNSLHILKMKKILIINGHPNKDSFNFGLEEAYKKGALQSNEDIKEIAIGELQFNPNLAFGFQNISELEPDLLEAQEKIKWSDYLVWVHPVWGDGLPAITKGFIDRVFLPGFAFKYRENSVWWDKLLAGKTARIIMTLDTPNIYYWFAFGRPSVNQLKKSTLEFCGIKHVKVTYMGPIRNSTTDSRKKMLQKVEAIGNENK